MEWHLYKPGDFNTYPQINCPMLVCFKSHRTGEMELYTCDKYIRGFGFMLKNSGALCTECYYAYIGYVPSGYTTHYTTKCTKEDDRCAYEDDGYCLNDETYACEYKRNVAEYSIEKKRIWKELEGYEY